MDLLYTKTKTIPFCKRSCFLLKTLLLLTAKLFRKVTKGNCFSFGMNKFALVLWRHFDQVFLYFVNKFEAVSSLQNEKAPDADSSA